MKYNKQHIKNCNAQMFLVKESQGFSYLNILFTPDPQ